MVRWSMWFSLLVAGMVFLLPQRAAAQMCPCGCGKLLSQCDPSTCHIKAAMLQKQAAAPAQPRARQTQTQANSNPQPGPTPNPQTALTPNPQPEPTTNPPPGRLVLTEDAKKNLAPTQTTPNPQAGPTPYPPTGPTPNSKPGPTPNPPPGRLGLSADATKNIAPTQATPKPQPGPAPEPQPGPRATPREHADYIESVVANYLKSQGRENDFHVNSEYRTNDTAPTAHMRGAVDIRSPDHLTPQQRKDDAQAYSKQLGKGYTVIVEEVSADGKTRIQIPYRDGVPGEPHDPEPVTRSDAGTHIHIQPEPPAKTDDDK